MQPDQSPSLFTHEPDLVSLNPIRVETALSRYPVHRLARKGSISIDIREKDDNGDILIKWAVKHEGGPQSYKLETLVINRKYDELGRPLPEVVRLGSHSEVCRLLGFVESGRTFEQLRKSFHQSAGIYIKAKIQYRMDDGTERSIEFGDTRYAVVFTGETLPDGSTADAIYLVLHKLYREILNTAQTRPLDYDYLQELPPASQRLYEIVSYQIYAALKHTRPRAKLTYSQFCTYAPLTRNLDYKPMKLQMDRIHAPHKKSGYIAKVEFEKTTDDEGRPDWLMLYTPGPKARTEYRAFTKRGRAATIELEPPSPATRRPEPKPEPPPEPTPLEIELIGRGVTATTARELVQQYPEERINAQVERADWIREKSPKKISDLGAYLVDAIRNDYAAPAGFVSRAERERRKAAEGAKRQAQAEELSRRRAEEAREREAKAKVAAYLKTLDAEGLARLDAEVLERADPETREGYERQHPRLRSMHLRYIREAHVRALLNLPPAPDA